MNVKAVIQLTDALERALGTPLFTRGRKGVGGLELTPFGVLVLARARSIVRECRKLEELGRAEKTMGGAK